MRSAVVLMWLALGLMWLATIMFLFNSAGCNVGQPC